MRKFKTLTSKTYPDQVAVIFKSEDGEFITHFFKNGADLGEGPRAYTDDKADAIGTAEAELKREWAAPVAEEAVSVAFVVDDQFCADILTTAAEGGSNYWGDFNAIANRKGAHGAAEWGTVRITDNTGEDTTDKLPAVVDLQTIRKGLAAMLLPGSDVADDTVSAVLQGLRDGDAGALDADAADAVLQFGIFGNLVFG